MRTKEDEKLSNRYYSMMARCYNKNNPKYKNYGARGVTVCDRWKHNCKQYCEDVKKLRGYDKNLMIAGKIQLDKDKLGSSNSIYSPETCSWVTGKENAQNKPSYMRWRYAWNNSDKTLVKFYNIEHFAAVYKQSAKNISTVATSVVANGWLNGWFLWDTNLSRTIKLFKATNINTGAIKYSPKCARLAEMIDKPVHKIYSANRPERDSLLDEWLIETECLTFEDVVDSKVNRLAVIK